MIDRRDLARALARHGASAWCVIERDQQLASVDEQGATRSEHRTRWQLGVHVDTPAGRGSAHVALDVLEGSADAVAAQAVELANAGLGPAWASPPPAAPARVDLDDGALRDPAAGARAALPRTAAATASALHEQVAVTTHTGFHTSWTATRVRVDAMVIAGDHSLAIARESRTIDGLGTAAAIADANRDLELLAAARAPAPGSCTLVLHTDALLHDGIGVWRAFVDQADAVLARQGLARYRVGAPVTQGAESLASPLSIESDGARPYGLRSAPVGDDGEAVRRWTLVDHGVAAGLALSPREASLRGKNPNGGVRNLAVATGDWNGTAVGDRVVEVRRLRSLAIDPYTGDASLEIALGLDRGAPFAGGSLRIDLIDALALARRSTTSVTRGAYVGPAAVWIDRAELLA